MDKTSDISIVICGEAGQGVQTIEALLVSALKKEGIYLFATKEYMSRVRGGSNSTQIRVSSFPVNSAVERIDVLIPLDKDSIPHLADRITDATKIFGDVSVVGPGKRVTDIGFNGIAKNAGNALFSSTAAVGFICGLLKCDLAGIKELLKDRFSSKGADVVKGNISAAEEGYASGARYSDSVAGIKRHKDGKGLLLSGSEVIAMGSLAGGCDFLSSYPMTPGSGVLAYMAEYSKQADVIIEQAEDEISAINMGLGAWYAGARAMVTTSGGGFDLMAEGVSLAGMIESPIVVHIGQRPGPATGLPTRTEQADLETALYSGHGEYPRAVLAPGSLEEAFILSQKAFNLADTMQVPVFILSDQYLVDSYYNMDVPHIDPVLSVNRTIETEDGYKRYLLTDDGISPRGVPGKGKGLVCVDSDEHDERGNITEDLDIRMKMQNKRMMKSQALVQNSLPPEITGQESPDILTVGWGSSRNAAIEAIRSFTDKKIAHMHISQPWPLNHNIGELLKSAGKIILIEGNSTGQLGKLIHLVFGIEIKNRVLKYDGKPFTVEDITDGIRRHL